MSAIDEFIGIVNDWFNSLSDIRKYALLAIVLGIVLLIIAIILW